MFFVMKDYKIGSKVFSRRIGRSTRSLFTASKLAIDRRGYIMDEHRTCCGQAVNPTLPKYLGSINKINISSGEDCFV